MTQPIYSAQLIKRIFASGAIGNILETYDLILISLMATTLSQAFFPPGVNPSNILYIILIGLLVRPIGSILMGLYADQLGRKKLMITSLVFTSFGTVLIGIIPTYSVIGIFATGLFILLRIVQNFFAGIEYISSATYLIESSPHNRRSFYGSWAAIGISGGYLLASLVALLFTYLISTSLIPAWCWRFVFIISLLGMFFGIWLRNSIPESLVFMLGNAATEPTKSSKIMSESIALIKNQPMLLLAICGVTVLAIYLSYIYYIYIPVQLSINRHFSPIQIFSLNVISLSLVVTLIPVFGLIADYFDRIKLLKYICLIILGLAVPFFWTAAFGSYLQILSMTLLISIPAAAIFSLYPVLITENFPAKIRCTTASLIYQIITSASLGVMPFAVNYINQVTRIPFAAGYLLVVLAVIGYFSFSYLRYINFTQCPSISRTSAI